MAVRSQNAHWKMRDILRRHWIAVGQRHGVSTEDRRPADALIDELIAQTPQVVTTVRAQLPPEFPMLVADSILEGLQGAADGLRG